VLNNYLFLQLFMIDEYLTLVISTGMYGHHDDDHGTGIGHGYNNSPGDVAADIVWGIVDLDDMPQQLGV
jgi:hypothetical protein